MKAATVVASLIAGRPGMNMDRTTMEPSVAPHNPKTSSWSREASMVVASAPANKHVTVQLKIDDDAAKNLETIFWAVSDPDHADYGKHLTIEQVRDVLAVPDQRVEKVSAFFREHCGPASVTVAPHRDVLGVDCAVPDLERALETKIASFVHKERPSVKVLRAAKTYSLPADIAEEVVMVGELHQFPALKRKDLEDIQVKGSGTWPNSCSQANCAGLVQPDVIRERYNLPNSSEYAALLGGYVNAQANSMAVAEFQGQYFEPSDLQSFSTACNRKVEVDTIIGGNNPGAGVEAELDIEYIKSVSPEIPLTVVYSAEYSLLNWANSINSNASSSFVHSVSYGNDEKQQTSVQYMYSCNTAFQKAGVQGRSILFASGDQGVCGREGCGFGIFGPKSAKPDFPGGSPFITVVGGTNFAGAGIGDEEVWNAGGGGFSNTFAIPAYQADAVKAYKANPDANLPDQKKLQWNNTGRGYPDIAALGGTKTPYCVATGGRFAGVAGTSAACPVAAGVFAKLNGVRLAAGKSPLGFLNPFIYKNPSGFHDVTQGMNNAPPNKLGFTAVKGWDASSGMGTPNFDALSKAVSALP
jgi:tripeptidyl-peptidase-1